MAKAYPKEFRDDVVVVARRGLAPLPDVIGLLIRLCRP